MRVLSKPEFDENVRYDELEQLLHNFGVPRDFPFRRDGEISDSS
jgi:hypothetical protein